MSQQPPQQEQEQATCGLVGDTMADSKKYDGSQWEHSLRKLTTSTDTLTTLPVDLYADGNNATVGLKGNMYQASGVSPTNPIQPQECGEMSSNLCDESDVSYSENHKEIYLMINNPYHLDANVNVALSTNIDCAQMYIVNATNNINLAAAYNTNFLTYSRTSALNVYIRLVFTGQVPDNLKVMFNLGSTALPYDKYGQYKTPISSANTTTPVYLGEVQTTRKIKKLVLTGEENYAQSDGNAPYVLSLPNNGKYDGNDEVNWLCSHYLAVPNSASWAAYNAVLSVGVRELNYDGTQFLRMRFRDTSCADLAAFKAYLAQQYANGTPVTIWYVLATETTGIVNEPLRKIGDYADTVSGITIPTITGADSFDVQTTLKPSEVSLSYTGWHDATVQEWDGSDWQ